MPKVEGRCDDHAETLLIQRVDDAEATVRTRLSVYTEQTAPLAAHYQGFGRLIEVDGAGSADRVYDRMKRSLQGPGVTQ